VHDVIWLVASSIEATEGHVCMSQSIALNVRFEQTLTGALRYSEHYEDCRKNVIRTNNWKQKIRRELIGYFCKPEIESNDYTVHEILDLDVNSCNTENFDDATRTAKLNRTKNLKQIN